MKKALIFSMAMLCCAAAAFAQDGKIQIFEDANAASCNLSDAQDGGVFVPEFYTYVMHVDVPAGATASEWQAIVPACATFQYNSEAWAAGMVPTSTTQAGTGVGYGGCKADPILLVTITCFTMQNTPACCMWCVEPNAANSKASVEAADCAFALTHPTGECSPVNHDSSCDCDEAPTPTEQKTWGGVKAIWGTEN